jgi:hypothetical protein
MKSIVRMIVSMVVVLGLFANFGFAAEMKTVVIDNFPNDPPKVSRADHCVKALANAGFIEGQNLVVHILHDQNLDAEIAHIRQLQPDLIIDISLGHRLLPTFRGTTTPLLIETQAEQFVDPQGSPRENITGCYTMLEDMVYNSYKFLQKIAPLKPGQQAVFLENTRYDLVPRAKVADALQRLQIPLKAVIDSSIYEDWQAAILKYNDDPDVGWILTSPLPSFNRDGTLLDPVPCAAWQREHLKKPTVTYWELTVRLGILAAFGVDSEELSVQVGEMAARVLKGEAIQSIKAEYPRKVSIVLNRKTAMNLGIVFSLDVLNLANVIYDDYEGKQVIRKK